MLLGCDVNVGRVVQDFNFPVAGDYELCRTSGHQISVTPSGGWSDDTPIIPVKVVEIAWDDTFVLAKQQHLIRRSPSNPTDTYEEPDPGKFSYWILDTSLPKSFGPLTLEAFNETRAQLEISDELTLRDVYDFKP